MHINVQTKKINMIFKNSACKYFQLDSSLENINKQTTNNPHIPTVAKLKNEELYSCKNTLP